MSIDLTQIQLTDAERQILAEVSERTGKPWAELLHEALRHVEDTSGQPATNGTTAESLFDRLSKHGLIGCLDGGPVDLSTNPAHMEGFGERDR